MKHVFFSKSLLLTALMRRYNKPFIRSPHFQIFYNHPLTLSPLVPFFEVEPFYELQKETAFWSVYQMGPELLTRLADFTPLQPCFWSTLFFMFVFRPYSLSTINYRFIPFFFFPNYYAVVKTPAFVIYRHLVVISPKNKFFFWNFSFFFFEAAFYGIQNANTRKVLEPRVNYFYYSRLEHLVLTTFRDYTIRATLYTKRTPLNRRLFGACILLFAVSFSVVYFFPGYLIIDYIVRRLPRQYRCWKNTHYRLCYMFPCPINQGAVEN